MLLLEAYGDGPYLGKPVRVLGSVGKASIANGEMRSAPEASRSERPPPAGPRGAGGPSQPALFGHSSYPGRDIDPHPKGATAQGFVPREPRGRARQQGRKQTRAGGRKGRGGAGGRRGGGAGLLASLQPPPNFSRPPFDSFPLRRTPELQSWRRVLRGAHPRGALTSAPPSGSPERPAPARWFRRRRPRPAPARTRSAPPPPSAAMLTPAWAGTGSVRRTFPAR